MLGLGKCHRLEHIKVSTATLMPCHEMGARIEASLRLRGVLGVCRLVLLKEERLIRSIYTMGIVGLWLDEHRH
jgi:hypothetical protein